MDPLHVTIAMTPVAMYLLLIGWINLTPRPFLTTGMRDLGALSLATVGFVITGPMELFLPETVASIMNGWVWVPMIMLYVLVVLLCLLTMRPRLIVYNIAPHELRSMLQDVVQELDPTANWVGDCVFAPQLGVQMAIESFTGIRNVTLASVGNEQNIDGWKKIEAGLRRIMFVNSQPRNVQGYSYVFLAVLLAGGIAYTLYNGHQEVAQAFEEMLRM